jgi:hypothetical protein
MTGAELLDRRCSKNSGGGIAPTASRDLIGAGRPSVNGLGAFRPGWTPAKSDF